MKKILLSSIVAATLISSAYASTTKESSINFYGINAKTDKNQSASNGLGMMYDSENIKVKLEKTSDFLKTGTVLKFNPMDGKFYVKVGANYLSQRMYSSENDSTKVNQYSAASALGYMIRDDIYLELGASYTKLNGESFGNYEIKDERTYLVYGEVAKRWETDIGTIDNTLNIGTVDNEFQGNETSYGLGVDYYPTNNSKIGYQYQHENNNTLNTYSAQYSYVFIEYLDNTSQDTHQVNAGLKIAFSDILDINTYKAPTNIKSNLSELHRFENITFNANMSIQSTDGVTNSKSAAPTASDASFTDTINIDLSSYVSDDKDADSELDLTIVSKTDQLVVSNISGVTFTVNIDNVLSANLPAKITYYVTDKDGNKSETKTITLAFPSL